MIDQIKTIVDLAGADLESFFSGKGTIFPGIGQTSLGKFYQRACLQLTQTVIL